MPPASASGRPPTEVRASHVRSTLEVLLDADPAASARVRARLDAAALAAAEAAPRLGWIPGAIDIALWRAIDAELGALGLKRIARAVGVRLVRGGHLSSLLQGVVQLFGLTPASIARWIPRGYADVHRGTGELRVEEVAEGAARFVLADLHPHLAGEPWLTAVACSFELALEVCGLEGAATLEQDGPDRAVMALRWRPRSPRA